jgi:hypothetical protein
MSTELTNTKNPFNRDAAESNGKAVTAMMTTKSASEMQAAVFMAKQFPRDQVAATDRILIACQRESLAAKACYCYARGGTDISGASIRLAEAIATNWGNLDCGIVELDRNEQESTVLAYAWDLETNYRCTKTFTVPHVRDTKGGGKKLTDSRDIYEHIANNGARRLRACILGVVPGDVVDAAVEQCNKTLTQKADTSPETLKKLVTKFAEFGVTKEAIEKRIQRKIESIRPAQLVGLRSIYNSLKDGMSEPADWFEMDTATSGKSASDKLGEVLKRNKSKETEATGAEPEGNGKTNGMPGVNNNGDDPLEH